jgi:L-ascorbate metabolism protein UlaG (beta-lactamase superfamily)
MECMKKIEGYTNSIVQGESFTEIDYNFKINAINAYNVYHAIGDGVGYVIELDNKKIYFAGDTGLIPEMHLLENETIDVAILPIGGKYTMNVSEAAEAAKIIKPKVLIPMHYNSGEYGIDDINTNPEDLKTALKNEDIQVVILSNA